MGTHWEDGERRAKETGEEKVRRWREGRQVKRRGYEGRRWPGVKMHPEKGMPRAFRLVYTSFLSTTIGTDVVLEHTWSKNDSEDAQRFFSSSLPYDDFHGDKTLSLVNRSTCSVLSSVRVCMCMNVFTNHAWYGRAVSLLLLLLPVHKLQSPRLLICLYIHLYPHHPAGPIVLLGVQQKGFRTVGHFDMGYW